MRIIGSSRPAKATMPLGAAVVLASALAGLTGCTRAKAKPELACTVLELRGDPASRYYDAVVRVDRVTLPDAAKIGLRVLTPTSSFELSTLRFTAEGRDPSRLEPGETFVVPLVRPDWKLSIVGAEAALWTDNFWDLLPPNDRWHPTKTEAMAVASSAPVVNVRGVLKPVPTSLPAEWRRAEETEPTADTALGSSVYRKVRGGRVVEQVEFQYVRLTEEQKSLLASGLTTDFLGDWSDCAKNGGAAATVAGHQAIVCDLEGTGDFGWTYRFFYIDSNVLVGADVQSDPQELGKTDAQKDLERRTDQVFLRYGYGPVGAEEWQVMIELRMNRTGGFHKRSRAGEVVDKDFRVGDDEFAAVEKALADNGFWTLESRSGIGSGFESFLAVQTDVQVRTVAMKNVRDAGFESIASMVRRIVLPKVEENGMQPKVR
ncbi:MAG TPA: hypothetical protein VMS75_01395 [Terriglobales bacterium]|nr:hypothetical protein [Terriglobales bacterium]